MSQDRRQVAKELLKKIGRKRITNPRGKLVKDVSKQLTRIKWPMKIRKMFAFTNRDVPKIVI